MNILSQIAPESFLFHRFTVAGVILLLLAVQRRSVARDLVRPGLLLGVLVFSGYFQTRGLLAIAPSCSDLPSECRRQQLGTSGAHVC